MDTQTMIVNTNKYHIVQSYDNDTIIIEFTEPQNVLPEEEYPDMIAYECYILDNDYEKETRAIYYYSEDDGTQLLKYHEDHTESKLTTSCIRNIFPITNEMSFEEALAKL